MLASVEDDNHTKAPPFGRPYYQLVGIEKIEVERANRGQGHQSWSERMPGGQKTGKGKK